MLFLLFEYTQTPYWQTHIPRFSGVEQTEAKSEYGIGLEVTSSNSHALIAYSTGTSGAIEAETERFCAYLHNVYHGSMHISHPILPIIERDRSNKRGRQRGLSEGRSKRSEEKAVMA